MLCGRSPSAVMNSGQENAGIRHEFSFLWHCMHLVGAFPPDFLWQSMQVPAAADGLWNAACLPVFIPACGGEVWQDVQAACGAVPGFGSRGAWWQLSHPN